jgi:hypothetical protein
VRTKANKTVTIDIAYKRRRERKKKKKRPRIGGRKIGVGSREDVGVAETDPRSIEANRLLFQFPAKKSIWK